MTTTLVPPTPSLSTIPPTLPTTTQPPNPSLQTTTPIPKRNKCKFHNLPKKWWKWSPFHDTQGLRHMMVCKLRAPTKKTTTVNTATIPTLKTEKEIIPIEVNIFF